LRHDLFFDRFLNPGRPIRRTSTSTSPGTSATTCWIWALFAFRPRPGGDGLQSVGFRGGGRRAGNRQSVRADEEEIVRVTGRMSGFWKPSDAEVKVRGTRCSRICS
jgi:hypothetical protein